MFGDKVGLTSTEHASEGRRERLQRSSSQGVEQPVTACANNWEHCGDLKLCMVALHTYTERSVFYTEVRLRPFIFEIHIIYSLRNAQLWTASHFVAHQEIHKGDNRGRFGTTSIVQYCVIHHEKGLVFGPFFGDPEAISPKKLWGHSFPIRSSSSPAKFRQIPPVIPSRYMRKCLPDSLQYRPTINNAATFRLYTSYIISFYNTTMHELRIVKWSLK